MQRGTDRGGSIGRWRLQAGCAAWAGAVCGLDSGVFATAVSLVGEKTGWADFAISTFAGIGFLGTFLATIFGGRLADEIGRKRLILLGLVAYFIGSGGLVAGAAVPAFAIGPGVCMWLVIPESLSSDVWATGLSVALLVDYAAVTAIITGFLPLTTAFGLSGGLRAFGVLLGDALFRVRIWVQGNQRQGTLMKTVLWA